MDGLGFGGAGEDIERALMDLGPLLGVSVKEETPDDAATPATVGSACEGGLEAGKAEGAEGADSRASPGAAGAVGAGAGEGGEGGSEGEDAAAGAGCVMCRAPLALAEGTPKLMECLHSACEPCLKARVEEKLASNLQRDFLGAERITITCPACRLQCQPSNMIDQRFVLEKAALDGAGGGGGGGAGGGGEQQCSGCEDTEPATSYCVDCAEFICDNCVQAHQRLKITKDHTIKSKEEALAELHAAQPGRGALDMFCRDHPQERLSLFCETCDRLTCRDCQLHHHRDHKYQFSTEMAAQARSSISALLSEVSYKRVLLGSAMKVIRDRQQLIADKKKALVHEITQTVVKLTNAINCRGKQLVLRLNEVCDAKQRTLTEKKDALEQLAAITDHCVRFVSHGLRASDTALLHAKRPVVAHLQRIKARRADIPNPEIPVRIALQMDKLPDLIRVLSSIGGIVVDGKVDGGAGGAQGPYHPPPASAQPPPAPHQQQQHSAVMALQHVAMHQSYVQAGVGGGAGGAYLSPLSGAPGGPRARALAHTPLRHAHVTSTTHPHHLHGMSEMNLRGLLGASAGAQMPRALSPAGARHAMPAHPAHAQAAMQHAYHQMMGAYASGAYGAGAGAGAGGPSGRRSGGPRTPSPAPAPAPPPLYPGAPPPAAQLAKWHTPQHITNGGFEMIALSAGGSPLGGGADFKITLGRQLSGPGAAAGPSPGPSLGPSPGPSPARAAPAVVTSTNPKTPSPSLNGGGGALSCELDKVCAESVQDLMATIAKLDSNGVQVVAEAPARAPPPAASSPASPAPLVHSSTAGPAPPAPLPAAPAADPNEDWCAVCMDGGELMCCDKCPKVFHQYCHIPTIEKLPDETESWQCLLCVNFAELPLEGAALPAGEAGLAPRQQKLVERVTLELYCQYELSLPFREPVPPDNLHYHSKISRPMCLDEIRMKLQPRSAARYTHVAHFVQDCRLLFRNAYHYNPPDSQIHRDAKRLEEFFDAQLAKWLPEFAYWPGAEEPPGKRARTH